MNVCGSKASEASRCKCIYVECTFASMVFGVYCSFFSSLNSSRSQSEADEMESSLDDSFEFVAESPTAEVELTKVECEVREFD